MLFHDVFRILKVSGHWVREFTRLGALSISFLALSSKIYEFLTFGASLLELGGEHCEANDVKR